MRPAFFHCPKDNGAKDLKQDKPEREDTDGKLQNAFIAAKEAEKKAPNGDTEKGARQKEFDASSVKIHPVLINRKGVRDDEQRQQNRDRVRRWYGERE